MINYDRLNNGVIAAKLKELDPSRLFWPTSPCSGPDDYCYIFLSDNRGDKHFWSVWHRKMSFDEYLKIYPRFFLNLDMNHFLQ